jgi:hypothetical protein
MRLRRACQKRCRDDKANLPSQYHIVTRSWTTGLRRMAPVTARGPLLFYQISRMSADTNTRTLGQPAFNRPERESKRQNPRQWNAELENMPRVVFARDWSYHGETGVSLESLHFWRNGGGGKGVRVRYRESCCSERTPNKSLSSPALDNDRMAPGWSEAEFGPPYEGTTE